MTPISDSSAQNPGLAGHPHPDQKGFENVLQFWFPQQLAKDQASLVRQWEWWFRGGADEEIRQHFVPVLDQAIRGELDSWAAEPRSRLALIIVLDQFPRSLYQGTAQAYAQDAQACALTLEGIDLGHYAALETPWEKTFFFLPLGHSEDLSKLDLAIKLADELVQEAQKAYRGFLEFSAEQARRHREVIAQFGRQPHRNAALGRQSTPAELDYLAQGQLVHQRSLPPHLSKFVTHS
uniref:DUF924 domain-containing protein n=1 Tax=Cyanothece sp. (strain PCC 7425 / ATCC 29141) TaxID=395961 RepID=B8HL52_CYAP4